MTATPRVIDFSRASDRRGRPSGVLGNQGTYETRRDGDPNAPRTPDGKLLTAKQIRARARRRAKRAEIMSDDEFNALYKPIEEWDLEELAAGRPKDTRGKFSGPTPKWITREVHEKSMERFKLAIKNKMNGLGVGALDAVQWVIQHDEIDEKGRPVVPASTKLDAAKFLLEHVVGKPTQRVESDISVKLQSILGVVMANPADALMEVEQGGQGYNLGHLPGVTMPMITQGVEDADIVDDDDETE